MATPIAFDGFTSLEGGTDSGISPSLIARNQVAGACNYSFRDAYIKTRPPWINHPLVFNNDATESRFTGKFQGSVFYQSTFGTSGFVISRGGKLFLLTLGISNVVSEITPTLVIVTTADFTVPAPAGSVVVFVNSEVELEVGDNLIIDSGSYTVTNRATGQITVTYNGGAAGATAPSGSSVLTGAGNPVIEFETNPSTLDFVCLFLAETYVIILAEQQKPVIYDGFNARVATIGEIPSGILGVYGWGRIWITLNDRKSFVAGDIVRGPSGTASLDFVDSILKFTENDFLNEGGAFGVPFNAGLITSMNFLNTQDTSLGVGVLLIGTTNMVFSVNAPVDRTTWKNLEYPIQTVSLLDYGPQGPRSTISINGDMWYRSVDGVRSFIVARRDINQLGQTPVSREIEPVLQFDTETLLFFGSSVLFDNKWFTTISPIRTDVGISHRALECINFDLISNLRGKSPPAWEGIQSGLDLFQVLKGTITNQERMFAFVDNNGDVELWELMATKKTGFYDQFTEVEGINSSITRTAIQSWMETKSYDFQSPFQPKILNMAELFVDQIVDNVTLTIKFRPDQYPTWLTWATIRLCASVTQCTVEAPGEFSCTVWAQRAKQYAARIRLPEPPENCNTIAGIPVNIGHEFQFRFEQTGHARIRAFRVHGIPQQIETSGECPAEEAECTTFPGCTDDWFTYTVNRGP